MELFEPRRWPGGWTNTRIKKVLSYGTRGKNRPRGDCLSRPLFCLDPSISVLVCANKASLPSFFFASRQKQIRSNPVSSLRILLLLLLLLIHSWLQVVFRPSTTLDKTAYHKSLHKFNFLLLSRLRTKAKIEIVKKRKGKGKKELKYRFHFK